MSNAPTSILDRLRARVAAPAAAPATGPAHPTPVMVQTAFGAAPVQPGHELAPGQVVVQPGQINPPEFQPEPTAEQLQAQKDESKPATPIAKRTRRTKAEMEAARAAEHADKVQGDLDILAVRAAAGRDAEDLKLTPEIEKGHFEYIAANFKTRVEGKPIPTLFVNCFPLKGSYVLASDLASKANTRICEDQKVPDYRFLQYGAGPGALRHAVMEFIDGVASSGECPPIMVDTSTPEGSALVTDLEARAQQTIRGIR